MNKRLRFPAGAVWLVCVLVIACSPSGEPDGGFSVPGRLSGDTSGYRHVTAPRDLRFPNDHGPHPAYKHEWWYITGQVETEKGRRFGFQFTLFREAVSPERHESPSHWATNQLYLAHAAVTDVTGAQHLDDERFARGALGLAGAQARPLRAWLEDWSLSGRTGKDGGLSARLVVRSKRFGFNLAIRNTRPPVAHGDRGMSIKGAAGNASYYYSYVRLDTRGTVRVDGESFDAAGEAWFDHEWSSSALQADQAGWDWFSLQLSNGAELMVFRLRHVADTAKDFYSGTYVAPSGRGTGLRNGQIRIRPLGYWTSGHTGIRYPVRWRVEIPDLSLSLTTEPWLDDQEMVRSFRYWEGAVQVSGKQGSNSVAGRGYVELAGYGPSRNR